MLKFADFVEIIDDWFDTLNSTQETHHFKPLKVGDNQILYLRYVSVKKLGLQTDAANFQPPEISDTPLFFPIRMYQLQQCRGNWILCRGSHGKAL